MIFIGMELPVNFEQFKKSPITAIAFLMLLVVGYLFYELRNSHSQQVESQNVRIKVLEEKVEDYEEKLEEVNQKLIECFLINQSR